MRLTCAWILINPVGKGRTEGNWDIRKKIRYEIYFCYKHNINEHPCEKFDDKNRWVKLKCYFEKGCYWD